MGRRREDVPGGWGGCCQGNVRGKKGKVNTHDIRSYGVIEERGKGKFK